jgi:hypothetical protein
VVEAKEPGAPERAALRVIRLGGIATVMNDAETGVCTAWMPVKGGPRVGVLVMHQCEKKAFR